MNRAKKRAANGIRDQGEAVDFTLLSRYYERFADHAVAVAHRVIYRSTGKRQD